MYPEFVSVTRALRPRLYDQPTNMYVASTMAGSTLPSLGTQEGQNVNSQLIYTDILFQSDIYETGRVEDAICLPGYNSHLLNAIGTPGWCIRSASKIPLIIVVEPILGYMTKVTLVQCTVCIARTHVL